MTIRQLLNTIKIIFIVCLTVFLNLWFIVTIWFHKDIILYYIYYTLGSVVNIVTIPFICVMIPEWWEEFNNNPKVNKFLDKRWI